VHHPRENPGYAYDPNIYIFGEIYMKIRSSVNFTYSC